MTLSRNHAVDAVRQFASAIQGKRSHKRRRELWNQLLIAIVRDQVPQRPNRDEPRAIKRRPEPYQLLNKPRRGFKEIRHRCRYCRNQVSKNNALI